MKLKLSAIILAATLAIVMLTESGCAGTPTKESTGEYIDDTAITSRVKSALGKDPQYKYDDVKVTTFKGSVQLSGFVNSNTQRNRAAEVVAPVQGVREVINNITVK